MIVDMDADVLWCILRNMAGFEIVRGRLVCRLWCSTVDSVPSWEWKAMYFRLVCDSLCVRPSFDWKLAVVRCVRECGDGLHAYCTWKAAWVCVVAPWFDDSDMCLDAPLRNGIERIDAPHTNDYLYDKSFRLRGIPRSCAQRSAHSLCTNCRSRSKRRCLAMRYDYYISERTDLTNRTHGTIDEVLALRLVSTESNERQT